MPDIEALGRARKSFEQRAWADAYRAFEAADREAPLGPEDLERLATAAYLMGREDESEDFRARAHQTFLERGDHEAAARSAGWLALGCSFVAPWLPHPAGSREPNTSSTRLKSSASCEDISWYPPRFNDRAR